MRHAVVVEVAAGGESLAAHLALVGLLATVDAAVGVEAAGRREPLVADHTHVRLLSWKGGEESENQTYMYFLKRAQVAGLHMLPLRPVCTFNVRTSSLDNTKCMAHLKKNTK